MGSAKRNSGLSSSTVVLSVREDMVELGHSMRIIILATTLLHACVGYTQEISLTPYTVDHHARVDSAVDARFLLDAPAGKHGFITVRDGHLATPDGKRFRIWGVNLSGWTKGSALLPPRKDAEVMAHELAREGVDCVRFQFLDLPDVQQTRFDAPTTYTPAGLIDAKRDDTRSMDKEQLDRLDYLISQLKANGIYVDFNLNV